MSEGEKSQIKKWCETEWQKVRAWRGSKKKNLLPLDNNKHLSFETLFLPLLASSICSVSNYCHSQKEKLTFHFLFFFCMYIFAFLFTLSHNRSFIVQRVFVAQLIHCAQWSPSTHANNQSHSLASSYSFTPWFTVVAFPFAHLLFFIFSKFLSIKLDHRLFYSFVVF